MLLDSPFSFFANRLPRSFPSSACGFLFILLSASTCRRFARSPPYPRRMRCALVEPLFSRHANWIVFLDSTPYSPTLISRTLILKELICPLFPALAAFETSWRLSCLRLSNAVLEPPSRRFYCFFVSWCGHVEIPLPRVDSRPRSRPPCLLSFCARYRLFFFLFRRSGYAGPARFFSVYKIGFSMLIERLSFPSPFPLF